jgi:hypothetical protein
VFCYMVKMMDGLYLNPILDFVVRIFIHGFYSFKNPTLLDKNCLFHLHSRAGKKCDSGWEICNAWKCSNSSLAPLEGGEEGESWGVDMILLVLFYSWLSPFLKPVRRGFQDLLKVMPSSLLMLFGCNSSLMAFLISWSM